MSALPAGEPNPLLRLWLEAHGTDEFRWMERDYDMGGDLYRQRQDVVRTFAFSVPTDEALDAIAAVGPIVELGAGTGYWASLLRDRDVDILAFDHKPAGPEHGNWWYAAAEPFTDVEIGDIAHAARHADRTLMLSWPPYSDPMAVRALEAYENAGGRTLVYIGEGSGGCCANDQFFARLGEETYGMTAEAPLTPGTAWMETRSMLLPQWQGINDSLTIYERKAP